MTSPRTYRLCLYVLALMGFALDQASKYGVFSWLKDAPQHRSEVVTGYFELVAQRKLDADGEALHVNQGALFGFGQQGAGTANGIFAAISLAAAAVIFFWGMLKSTARDRWLCIALGLILAGTLGNLYDRLLFGGVRDFLHFYIDRTGQRVFDWPVFNIADCCLVVGAAMLLIQAFLTQSNAEEKPATSGGVAVPATGAECVGAESR